MHSPPHIRIVSIIIAAAKKYAMYWKYLVPLVIFTMDWELGIIRVLHINDAAVTNLSIPIILLFFTLTVLNESHQLILNYSVKSFHYLLSK